MNNKESLLAALNELRQDNAKKQKRGIHFILASLLLWTAILIIQSSSLSLYGKNLFSFFCSAPLVPLALLFSRLLHIDFQNKENPLTKLGLLCALNQMLYILITMWVFTAVPEKMIMVYAMILGAHFLPYGWLYQSKSYYIFSIAITFISLFIGLCLPAAAVALFIIIAELILCILLTFENRKA